MCITFLGHGVKIRYPDVICLGVFGVLIEPGLYLFMSATPCQLLLETGSLLFLPMSGVIRAQHHTEITCVQNTTLNKY